MKHASFFLPLGALLMSNTTLGQKHNMFLDKYKETIQNYIMTGHERGWKQCDILSADRFSYDDTTHISMDMDKILTLDMKSAFASSQCLLVTSHVDSTDSLKALLDFGWATIQHFRLALVMHMDSGVTLDMITNATNLPFLIAADLGDDKEQFLCPVVGEMKPLLQHKLCQPSYVSTKNKTLRVGLLGILPHFAMKSDGSIEGANLRMIKILEDNLNFTADISVPNSYEAAEFQVCNCYFIYEK